MRKFGEVFIGWNGNIGYNYNKCRQKKRIKHVKKTCRMKVEKLTTVKKRVFLRSDHRSTCVS